MKLNFILIHLISCLWLFITSHQAWAAPLTGYYVGDFVAERLDPKKDPMHRNKINISIDSVKKDRVQGHSVVAGNLRPFSGSIRQKGDVYVVKAREPGDNQYDGTFEFTVDPRVHQLKGRWTANDKQLAVTTRTYSLQQRVFQYNPKQNLEQVNARTYHGGTVVYDGYDKATNTAEVITPSAFKINASSTLLTSKDVENMHRRDLEVMRNAIYARHGYSFQNREMRFYFDRVDWYIPVSVDVTRELTEMERKNIEILKRYEKHAATYYDRFGR